MRAGLLSIARRSERLRALLRSRWRALLSLRQRMLLSEESIHLLLAVGVGILGGMVNLLLHWAAEGLQVLVLGVATEPAAPAAAMAWWQRLAWPAAGGLFGGLILHWSSRVARFPDSGNVLEVVAVGDGALRFRSALSKALASVVAISTGGSIGREGPVVHLGATLASQAGRLAGWPPYRLRLLVACGAAAGMAAAYNAPIGGAVFAAQIVLGSFSMSLLGPVLVSAVVAAMVSRSFFGIQPWYDVPTSVEFTHISQLPWFAALGLVCGGVGALFMRLLREVTAGAARLAKPLWARVAAGGLLVGMIAVFEPRVWGNGYGPANDILHGHLGLELVLGLLVAKLFATVLTVGSGAAGGVFTPTLLLGACSGGLLGLSLHQSALAQDLPDAAFVLVGMGAMLASTTHSPLLAMILVFEISLNYTLMPPLMVACVVATLSARRLHPETIYTEPLRRRGIQVERNHADPGSATQRTVGDMMRAPVPPVRETTSFRELADRFLTSPYNHMPVVDAEGRLIGLVALQDLKHYLGAGQELEGVIAFDVMRPPPAVLTPDERIAEAVPILLTSELRNVPVVNTRAAMRLVGSVARSEALGLVSEAIDFKAASPS